MSQLRTLFHIATLLTLFYVSIGASHAQDLKAPLFDTNFDYDAVSTLPNCNQRVTPRTKYFKCKNSAELFVAAKDWAKASNQPLMVIFGFDECPSCQAIEQLYFGRKEPISKEMFIPFVSDIQAKTKDIPTISVARIHIRNENAEAMVKRLGLVDYAESKNWHRLWSPFIVLFDPKTGEWHSEETWDSEIVYCYDAIAEIAVSLEELGYMQKGKTLKYRETCKA